MESKEFKLIAFSFAIVLLLFGLFFYNLHKSSQIKIAESAKVSAYLSEVQQQEDSLYEAKVKSLPLQTIKIDSLEKSTEVEYTGVGAMRHARLYTLYTAKFTLNGKQEVYSTRFPEASADIGHAYVSFRYLPVDIVSKPNAELPKGLKYYSFAGENVISFNKGFYEMQLFVDNEDLK